MISFEYLPRRLPKSSLFPDGHDLLYPTISVTLIHRDKRIDGVEALVDSGSDFCVFSYEYGKDLGLSIKSGKRIKMKGIRGSLKVWFHDIKMRISDTEVAGPVGFARLKGLPVSGILGHVGFFENFTVSLNDRAGLIKIS